MSTEEQIAFSRMDNWATQHQALSNTCKLSMPSRYLRLLMKPSQSIGWTVTFSVVVVTCVLCDATTICGQF